MSVLSDKIQQATRQKWFIRSFGTLLLFPLIIEFRDKWNVKVKDIPTFFIIIDSVGFITSMMMSWSLILKPTFNQTSPSTINSKTKFEIPVTFDSKIILFFLCSTFLYVSNLIVHSDQWIHFQMVANFLETMYLFQCIASKNNVLTRMNMVLKTFQKNKDEEELMTDLRPVLKYNSKINKEFCLQSAGWVLRGMALCLHSFSAYWLVYGLHFQYDCYEFTHPILSIFSQRRMMFIYEILAMVSTSIRDHVSIFYLYNVQLRVSTKIFRLCNIFITCKT